MAHRTLLLGHRGAGRSGALPENTIPSFDLALKHGCDGFEFDVRLGGDGRALICHDDTVDGVLLAEVTAAQMRHVPVLEDVLQRYPNRVFLNIEVKVPGLESKVVSGLRERMKENYVVSSFLPEVVETLRLSGSTLVLGFICDQKKQLSRWQALPVQYVIPHYSLLSAELIAEIHAARGKVFAWTVNDSATMLRLADWEIDGIISDKTELLVKTLG